jgi:hypothetical protein
VDEFVPVTLLPVVVVVLLSEAMVVLTSVELLSVSVS